MVKIKKETKPDEKIYPHACGQCGLGFDTEEEYLDHKCEKSGFTPREPENLGPGFEAVSQAAQERGEARKEE